MSYRPKLVREIERLKARRDFRREVEDTFPGWVLLTAATLNEEKALSAVVGGAHDREIDALYINDDEGKHAVWIVQGKFRRRVNGGTESRHDVDVFADLARYLVTSEEETPEFWADIRLNQFNAAGRFREARARVQRGYPVRLVFASLHNFDEGDVAEATRSVRDTLPTAVIDFFDGDAIGRRLDDYLYDVMPSIDPIELNVLEDSIPPIRDADVAAYSFSVRGNELAELYRRIGDPLFARNIRWYMGENPVNLDIEKTVRETPERFWLYNNGITFIADTAVFQLDADSRVLRLEGGQLVNGQQTTRTLHALWSDAHTRVQVGRTRVPVRVIEIHHQDVDRRDALVSGIVRATNWQTAVSMADLHSNDRVQIDLQRDLFARGYVYKRKRAASGEEPPVERPRNYVATFTKEDAARAVAGIDEPGRALIEGITPLFDAFYQSIFNDARSTDLHLAALWMWRKVRDYVGGDVVRGASKYIVHYEVWRDSPVRTRLRQFSDACASRDDLVLDPLGRAIDAMYGLADRAYRQYAANPDVPPATYFKRPSTYNEVIGVWNGNLNGQLQRRYSRAIAALEAHL